jgi:NAD(P)-dependent dehydrogenase (short-subunit alcohol dehydrogenase family)
MKDNGYDILAVQCDVADIDSATRAVGDVQSKMGAIDILVNNAGITRDMTFKKMDKVNWDAVMRTNLDSLFNMSKQVVDGMVERNWGRVINVSSVNGSKGAFGQTNYSAAKAGVHGFTKALALEVAKKGVTVNTISPGYIGTKMVTAIPEGHPQHQDPAADPGRPARQARGSRGPDHLPRLGRGGLPDRREHRHQRRPAHAMTPPRRRQQQGALS